MNPLPERIGPYTIRRPIGQGGFGRVFEATDERIGQRVALKVLLPEKARDRGTVARFIQEGKALETLKDHPGVVRVVHSGETADGRPYFAMEFLDGLTLRKWFVEQEHRVSLEAALALGGQIATTMVAVHDRNLVHRDLKPENIMLIKDAHASLGWRPIVLDFGIAKMTKPAPLDDQATTRIKTHEIGGLGTTQYMAPEQFNDPTHATTKADVYVLGLVIYELLAGKPPFQADDEVELALMHCNSIPRYLHDLVPGVPPALATFIAAMLAKKPEERPLMCVCRDMFAHDWTRANATCPFPGLQPFNDTQAHLFFGRHRETQQIQEKLVEMHTGQSLRWLQIQGPSGVGKSSLVHAAILPSLARSKQWFIVTLRPAEDPIRSLALAFAAAYGKKESDIEAAFRKNPGALDHFLQEFHTAETTVLVVLDQFEELFVSGGASVSHFEQLLAKALDNTNCPLRVSTTIRSDYLHRLEGTSELKKLLARHAWRYDLLPIDEAALFEIVGGMANLGGLRLENGLAQKIVHDATGNDYRLPLLGHTLHNLWTLRRTGEITHEQYNEMGGVGGALAKQAGDLLASLDDHEQERAKWMILALVQVGQGALDTRRPRTRAEVMRAAGESESAEKVWRCLSGDVDDTPNRELFRLLVVSGEALDQEHQRVDLVHEMVLHKVPIVNEWINAERKFLELLTALESATLEWHRSEVGKPKDGLPMGTLLKHYEGGNDAGRRQRLRRMTSAGAREYLDEAARLERRQWRIRMGIGAAMFAAVVAIVVFAIAAVRARDEAKANLEAMFETTDEVVHKLDWHLGRLAHTVPLRRNILEYLYGQLLKLEDSDPDGLQQRLIDTEQRLSDLERAHGTIAASERYLNAADGRIAARLKQDPTNEDYIALQALNLSKRGKLRLLQGENKEALEDFQESIRQLESTARKSDYSDEQTLATSYVEKGDAFTALGQFEAARKSYTTGWYLRRALVTTAQADNLSYRRAMVAEALTQRARVIPDSAVARRDLDEARAIARSLVQEEEHNLLYQSILGTAYLRIADSDRSAKQWPEAQTSYQRAESVGVLLHESAPEQKEYALLLMEALSGLETVAVASKDIVSAEALRGRRCGIMKESATDMDDKRFVREGCP